MSYACDERGYINFVEGLVIDSQYKVKAQIGKGTFSRVMKCEDLKAKKDAPSYVALKINRNVDKYQAAAKIELEILSAIKKIDINDISNCAHLTTSFDYYGHRCFVFPLFGRSVYGFLSANKYTPFASTHVKQFAWQIIAAVKFLHENQIIFTDLKPENIVFVRDRAMRRPISQIETKLPSAFSYWKKRMENAGYSESDIRRLTVEIPVDPQLKVIDFGSALFENTKHGHHHLVQTRHYRAPEVVLGMKWTYPIDIWSIGCIMLEFIYGRMVFNTHDSVDHLNQMNKMIGPMPASVTNRIPDEVFEAYFHKKTKKLKIENAKISTVQCLPLKKYFGSSHDDKLMHDLVSRMLQWDPNNRISAAEAMRHEYFKDVNTKGLNPRKPEKSMRSKYSKGT